MLRRVANRMLSPLGLKLVPSRADQLYYQHDYGAGGMDAYRREQVRANKAKFDWIWADERTLEAIAEDIEAHRLPGPGLCHGARNGFEVEWFAGRLERQVLGTDISDTAEAVPYMVCHDFHEPRADWLGRFDFIYTNSLDQAFDPARALATWADQLSPQGRLYIEHTMQHSAAGASAMDPFGAHPMAVPYLLFEWGRGHYELIDILHVEQVARKGHVWVFVVGRVPARAAPASPERESRPAFA